jgi:putative SOS response-associated peptidase YedK
VKTTRGWYEAGSSTRRGDGHRDLPQPGLRHIAQYARGRQSLATNAGDDSYGEATPVRVVRNAGAERELAMMRWGMPPPPKFGGPPVTNIRNTSSPHWRGWLRPENRCLVPANGY